jgi:biotin transporter BioY
MSTIFILLSMLLSFIAFAVMGLQANKIRETPKSVLFALLFVGCVGGFLLGYLVGFIVTLIQESFRIR